MSLQNIFPCLLMITFSGFSSSYAKDNAAQQSLQAEVSSLFQPLTKALVALERSESLSTFEYYFTGADLTDHYMSEFGDALENVSQSRRSATEVRLVLLKALEELRNSEQGVLLTDLARAASFEQLINEEIDRRARFVNPYIAGTVGVVAGLWVGLIIGTKVPSAELGILIFAAGGITGSYIMVSLNEYGGLDEEVINVQAEDVYGIELYNLK